jgi:chromosome segregation ATPase
MPKILSTILIYAVVALVIAGAAVGSVYVYNKDSAKSQVLDKAVQNFDLQQKQYQDAVNKLKDMKDTYIAQSALNSYIASQYSPIENAFHAVDTIVANDKKDLLVNTPDVSKETQAKITTLREQINTKLNDWKNTIDNMKLSTTPDAQLINTANEQISTLQSYVNEVKNIVDNLTPDSTTTQQQINDYQNLITTTQQTIQTISDNLTQIENTAGAVTTAGVTTITPVTQTDIQTQQTVVDQISTQINSGSTNTTTTTTTSSSTSTTSSTNTTSSSQSDTSSGTYVPPPPKPGDTSAPKLIEGANKY